MPLEQSVTRSWLSWLVMRPQPPFSSPTRYLAGTRTSSKNVALMSCSPIRCSGWMVMPGVSIGTMITEMPLCFLASGSVRTASQQ